MFTLTAILLTIIGYFLLLRDPAHNGKLALPGKIGGCCLWTAAVIWGALLAWLLWTICAWIVRTLP